MVPQAQRLGQNRFDNVTVDIGEPEVPTLEFVSQGGMIEAEKMKNGGLKVVDVDRVFVVLVFVGRDRGAGGIDQIVAVFVGFSEGEPGLDPASGHPK